MATDTTKRRMVRIFPMASPLFKRARSCYIACGQTSTGYPSRWMAEMALGERPWTSIRLGVGYDIEICIESLGTRQLRKGERRLIEHYCKEILGKIQPLAND